MGPRGPPEQERYGRSIINGLHATWSIAAVGAGLVGAAAVGLGVPILVHFGVVAALLLVASTLAWRYLLPEPSPEVEAPEDGREPAACGGGLQASSCRGGSRARFSRSRP